VKRRCERQLDRVGWWDSEGSIHPTSEIHSSLLRLISVVRRLGLSVTISPKITQKRTIAQDGAADFVLCANSNRN
jgi:hypothetical protein